MHQIRPLPFPFISHKSSNSRLSMGLVLQTASLNKLKEIKIKRQFCSSVFTCSESVAGVASVYTRSILRATCQNHVTKARMIRGVPFKTESLIHQRIQAYRSYHKCCIMRY
jgi:hypothetical protein